ncbi:DUF4234 domain-containing protein [Orbus wheelerorum]|uniref:DUF4234 domain-containing protein n=1 Tax=Orbus wheelerorum TaxID=3074111 RepID=UPI00370DCB7B
MRDIDFLKQDNNLTTFHFLLLSLLTLGLYDYVWMYKMNKSINQIIGMKVVSNYFIIILLSAAAWGSLLNNSFAINSIFYFIGTIFIIISFIMSVVWANKAKNTLIYHCLGQYNMNVKTNNFYIVIFNIFYINYIINSLSDIKKG